MKFETPEDEGLHKNYTDDNCQKLWTMIFEDSFKKYGSSKAIKDADKAVKEFKQRF